MRVILVQMKVVKGENHLPAELSVLEKDDMLELAYSTIILHLGDRVLREVSNESLVVGVYAKLEHMYMMKTLTNRVYLKDKWFGFKMREDRNKS